MVSIYDLTAGGILPLPPGSPGGPPASPGGLMGGLDLGGLMKASQRQKMFNSMTQIGAGLMQAGMGGPYGSQQRGLGQAMQGLSQAGQTDPMDMVRAQYMLAQMNKPPERKTVQGADGYMYYQDTGERVLPGVEAPEKRQDLPAGFMYDEAGNVVEVPGYVDMRSRIARAGRDQTNVNLPPMESEFAKTLGKQQAETYNQMQAGAREAIAQNQNLDALDQTLDGLYTGLGGPTLQQARKLGKLFGVEGLEGDIAAGEAGRALSGRLALQLRNPAGGAGMPGSMSDADREFLSSMSPSLATSREGRKMMVEALKRQNQRSIEVAQMADEYLRANGNMIGFEQALAERFANNPEADLFSDLEVPAAAVTATEELTDMSNEDLMKGLGF